MIGSGLIAMSVARQHDRIDAQPRRQPRDRDRRCHPHLVRHESQPRQCAQLNSQTETITRAATAPRCNESSISRRQSEEPDQLVVANIREPPQRLELIIGEQTRRHKTPPRHTQTCSTNVTNEISSSVRRPYPLVFRRLLPGPLNGRPNGVWAGLSIRFAGAVPRSKLVARFVENGSASLPHWAFAPCLPQFLPVSLAAH